MSDLPVRLVADYPADVYLTAEGFGLTCQSGMIPISNSVSNDGFDYIIYGHQESDK